MTVVTEALRSPYKGLSAFDESELDALLFFGRESETEIVAANALASRLTVLYGPSGVGKSSLLRAGVVRALRALSETEDLAVAYLSSWSGDPVAAIEEAARGALADAFGGDPGDAPGDLADRLDAWTAALGCELLLIFDQFEELFLYHAEGGLLDLLPELVTRPGLRVNVVLGIRDDELARLDVFKARIPGLFSNYLRLDLLDRESARAAVLGPIGRYNELESAGIEIEPALVEAILGEVAAGRIDAGIVGRGAAVEEDRTRIETPYLQLVLQRLWEVERERRSDVLRLSTLAALGGAQQIVEDHLERAMAALTPPEQDVAAGMFDHLVTPSGAKIAHGVADLASFAHVDAAQLEPVLHSLARERILRPTGENGHVGDRYEIYHDVLAGAVLAWRAKHEAERALAAERVESRRRQRRLAIVAGISIAAFALMAVLTAYAYSQRNNANHQTALAREQTRIARDQIAIARVQRANAIHAAKVAEAAKHRAQRATDEVSREKAKYVRLNGRNKSLAESERVQRARADQTAAQVQSQNTLLAQNAATLEQQNLALTAAKKKADRSVIVANQATDAARAATARVSAANKQTNAGELLQRSLAELGTDPIRSVNDALASTNEAAVPGAEGVLRSALLADHERVELPAGGPAQAAAYSPDSSKIAVADGPGKLSVFAVSDGRLLASFTTSSPLAAVAWAPGGQAVAVGAKDGTVNVYDVGSKALVRTLPHGGPVVGVAFSPDGRTLATAGGRTAKLWDAASGVLEATLPHTGALRKVSFSPDGGLLLTVSNETAAHVWDVASGELVSTLSHNKAGVTDAAFGPNDLVVTGSRDNTGRIWNARTGTLLGTLIGHTAQISTVAFSPLGDKVATGSVDGSVRVWSTSTFGLLDKALLSGPVVSVAFAPDGQSTIAADNTDRAVTLGPAQLQMELLGQKGTMHEALFAPDARTVATVAGSTVRLWEPYGEPRLRGIHKDTAAATSVVFDPTGKLIASGDANGDVLVQRVHGDPLRTLHIGSPIVSLAWARDGMLLIGASDGTAHLRLGAGETDTCAISHGSPLVGAALRNDGAVVATAGTDGFVRLWDSKTCRRLRELHPPPGVTSVALDPTGGLLAVGDGSTIVVYDARSGDQRAVLPGHTDTVTGVAFSHDGSQLASSSRDHNAGIWDARTFQLVKLLRRHTSFVSGVAFSSDDRWVATAGPLKAGIWETRATDLPGDFMFFVRGNVLPINSVAFSPRGWEVATASRDGSIRVFDCKLCGRLPDLESYARAQLSSLKRAR